ncbi:erythromycin esterase family protein [Nonomuraea sp. NPDC050556]|uniref:erythromycin esterase family protein n=1 Tax=Nonomuraea sp. NPDC050556 TaxID=3364369 RepID=UPI00379E0EBF
MTLKDAGSQLNETTFSAFLHSRTAKPSLLALGEPTHGVEGFPLLRNRLFKHLVEHEGHRGIALESDCMAGLIVDDYVVNGVGDLDTVMRTGFSHGWGASPANRELVVWMREHNEGRAPADRVHFYGFDAPTETMYAQSPRQPLTALLAYLGIEDTAGPLIGDDERWTNEAAAMDPSQSVGNLPEVAELRLLADDLVSRLWSRAPELIAASPEAFWLAELHGRTAQGLLRYHAEMAGTSPERLNTLCALRDTMMAHNLLAIAERGPAMVFAHNSHLQRDMSTMTMGEFKLEWWSAGAIAATQLGDRYTFLATTTGAAPGLLDPGPDTIEGALSALPDDTYLFDAVRLAGELGTGLAVSPTDYRYGPLDPAKLAEADGVVFISSCA